MAYWSNSETKALVESWKESMVEHQLNELPIVRNKFLYMDIVSRMNKQGYTSKDWKQCRTKLKGLVSKYRKVRMLNKYD